MLWYHVKLHALANATKSPNWWKRLGNSLIHFNNRHKISLVITKDNPTAPLLLSWKKKASTLTSTSLGPGLTHLTSLGRGGLVAAAAFAMIDRIGDLHLRIGGTSSPLERFLRSHRRYQHATDSNSSGDWCGASPSYASWASAHVPLLAWSVQYLYID
jgi:hypothetical protein